MNAQRGRWLAGGLVLVLVAVLAGGCGSGGGGETSEPQAVTQHVKGSDVVRVTLTADAARRLGVQTTKVRRNGAHAVIPYEALLYDPDGKTWAYVSPRPLVFQRMDVTVQAIEGDSVVLAEGPAAGMPVVTVGAAEIWGVEYGGIEED
jgi:hypothetical protein